MQRDSIRRWVSHHRLGILVAAVALGVMGFGTWRLAPHLSIPDEAAAVRKALRIGYERDPFPPVFKKGGNLHLYLLAGSFVPVVAWWLLTGQFGDITSAATGLPREPSWDLPPELLGGFYDALFAGRLLSVAFGVATVFVVYLLAREIAGERAGLLGAVTLTVTSGYVLTAHYATEDVPMTFFVMLTFLLLVRARRASASDARYLHLAALSFGLATATKASSGVLVLAVGAVIVERHRDSDSPFDVVEFIHRTWRYPAIAVGAYLGTTPSIFLYPGLWFDEVARYSSNVAGSNVTYSWPDPGWLTQLAHLSVATGLPLFLLCLGATAGVVWLLARGRTDSSLWLLVGVAVPYAFVISHAKMAQYPRVIPLLPFLAVFVGVGVDRVAEMNQLLRRLSLGVFAAVVVFSAVYTGIAVAGFNQSRQAATEWNHETLGADDEVVVYSQRIYLPEFPENVTVNRYEVHSENPESNWRPGLRRLSCDQPEYVILSSNHYDRFFKDPSTYPDVTDRFRQLIGGGGRESENGNGNVGGYRVIERFGPPINTDHSAAAKFEASATFGSYRADGNPTIVVLERTSPPSECPGTVS